MKLRMRHGSDGDAFDGFTAEDIRRIRGAASAAGITPGLEDLAVALAVDDVVTVAALTPPKGKRGVRNG